jgi:threonine dehydrogenase-like Zn-dependent dehydrogenase
MTDLSKAAVLTERETIEIQEFQIPEMGEEDLLLKVEMCGVCGSDAKSFMATRPQNLYPKGVSRYPRILGDEVVGRVEQLGTRAKTVYQVNIGDRVVVEPRISCTQCRYCLTGSPQQCLNAKTYGNMNCDKPPYLVGGQSEFMMVIPGSRLHKVPETLSPEACVLAAVLLPDAMQWVETKGSLKYGDNLVILGPGPQGLASTLIAREKGAGRIIVAGLPRDRKRLSFAKELGADFTVEFDSINLVEPISNLTRGEMADVVIECAGSSNTIQASIDLVRPMGTVVLMGVTDTDLISMPTMKIVRKEVTVIGAMGYMPWMVKKALGLAERKEHLIKSFITKVFTISNTKEALEAMVRRRPEYENILKVAVVPD